MKTKLNADCALWKSTVHLGGFLDIERANMLLSIFHLYQMLLPPFTPGSIMYLCIHGNDSIWKICLKCVTRCSESFSGADGLVAFKFLSDLITKYILAASVLSLSTF